MRRAKRAILNKFRRNSSANKVKEAPDFCCPGAGIALMHRQQRWIDYPGLNMIRIVIGSYFMAIALGLISGVSPPALFVSVTDPRTADLVGTVLLFAITAAFMLGLYLRLTSLMLAIFVFASSATQNLVLTETALVEPFWRDLTMVCAVLLSYTCLKRSEISRAALVMRRGGTPRMKIDQTVVPRRVTAGASASERVQPQSRLTHSMKPLMQSRAAVAEKVLVEARTPKAAPRRHEAEADIDVDNIFVAM